MSGKAAAIINPRSGGGQIVRDWARIEARLRTHFDEVATYHTDHAGTATDLPAAQLARRAIEEGARTIIAVGGDGTINEVVNGIFNGPDTAQADARLALLNAGTGGDFRKSFDIPADSDGCLDRILSGATREVDIGRMTYVSDAGETITRYFDNIASFGLSGAVDRAVNRARFSKLFGGTFAYMWNSLTASLRYRQQRCHITTNEGFDQTFTVNTAAVCNGRFFGGGMMMAPDATQDDGLFDLVIMADTNFLDFIKSSGDLYEGTHIQNPKVTVTRASRIIAEPVDKDDAVLLDIDGEAPGRLPATFEILPKALTLLA